MTGREREGKREGEGEREGGMEGWGGREGGMKGGREGGRRKDGRQSISSDSGIDTTRASPISDSSAWNQIS